MSTHSVIPDSSAGAIHAMAMAEQLGLTDMQRRFSETYAVDLERNATRAAIAIGCTAKSAHVTASKWLKLSKVNEYIRLFLAASGKAPHKTETRLTADRIMSAQEVLQRLSDQARVDMADFVTVLVPSEAGVPPEELAALKRKHITEGAGFAIDVGKAVEAGKSHLIKELGFDSAGLPKIKLVDPQPALERLAKFYRLGDDEKPANQVTLVQVIQQVQPETRVQAAKALLVAAKEVT